MYVGRIVAIGKTPAGKSAAMYRVSSRSFPNREARLKNETVSIMPRKGFEDDLNKNPYIAYNCIRLAGNFAVATNGSHTDPITEKILSGMNVRDALAFCMLALDYEKDSFNTPRIAAVVEEIVTAGNIILYIPDIHNLVKSSSAAYLTAADALMPVIKNDAFPVMGTSYPREFKQFIEPRSRSEERRVGKEC